MLLACLLSVLASSPQDLAPGATLVERIDKLIETSNAYEHFVAVYRMRSRSGAEGELHVRYRGPGWAYFETTVKGSEGAWAIVDGEIHLASHSKDGAPMRGTAHGADRILLERDRLGELLGTALPGRFRPADLPSGFGIHFGMHMLEVAPAGRDGFNIDLNYNIGSATRFGWLEEIRRAPEQAQLSAADPKLILFTPSPSVRISISAESGLVEKIERKGDEGFVAIITLASLDLETTPARAEFELPVAEPGAKDITADLDRGLEREVVQSARSFFYEAVLKMNADGRLDWGDEVRDKLVGVLEAEHDQLAQHALRATLAKVGAGIDDLARHVHETLDAASPPSETARTELIANVRAQRSKMEEACATLWAQYAESALAAPKVRSEPAFLRQLGELEKGVLSRVQETRLTQPVRASFDEKVAKQLEPK